MRGSVRFFLRVLFFKETVSKSFFLPGRASWAANEMEGKNGSLPVFLGWIAPQEFCFEMDKIKGVSEKNPLRSRKKNSFVVWDPQNYPVSSPIVATGAIS